MPYSQGSFLLKQIARNFFFFLLGLHYIVKVEKTTAQFAYGLKSKSFKWLTLTVNLG